MQNTSTCSLKIRWTTFKKLPSLNWWGHTVCFLIYSMWTLLSARLKPVWQQWIWGYSPVTVSELPEFCHSCFSHTKYIEYFLRCIFIFWFSCSPPHSPEFLCEFYCKTWLLSTAKWKTYLKYSNNNVCYEVLVKIKYSSTDFKHDRQAC